MFVSDKRIVHVIIELRSENTAIADGDLALNFRAKPKSSAPNSVGNSAIGIADGDEACEIEANLCKVHYKFATAMPIAVPLERAIMNNGTSLRAYVAEESGHPVSRPSFLPKTILVHSTLGTVARSSASIMIVRGEIGREKDRERVGGK